MAATMQPQQANPQLKRLVYSKYREMLGSYNDKANTIIQSLPSYMVTEDKGFNFENKDNIEEGYGGATAQPPACVQNAMMTKDKKPFTYTPGGIDLSEIKSPRMAKRIARNAQFEGVTGQPKPSPLAQPNATQHIPSAAPQPTQHGMPVQVFPSPPPPPPLLSTAKNGAPPPPPPQPSQNQLKPQSNGVETRRSPTPQNFEPPPLGCRPEIKIPPNPMASLKKVPKPREKNDFWIEEYRKERSTSPMIGASSQAKEQSPPSSNYESYPQPQQQQTYAPIQSQQQYRPPSPARQQYQEQQHVQQSVPMQYSPHHQNRVENPFSGQDSANFQRPLSPVRSNQQPQQQPQQLQRQAPPSNRWQAPTAQQQQQQQQQQQRQQHQQQPIRNAQVGTLYIPPVAPENLVTSRQTQKEHQEQLQEQQQRQVTVSSPPTPRWLAKKPNMKEVPEWVRDEDTSSPVQRTHAVHSPPSSGSPSTAAPAMNFQIAGNAPNAKERIIPIQFEQPGTPTRTPGTPGFGPQPFYNANQQFSSVSSPSSGGSGQSGPGNGVGSPNYAATRNPNQFVDQGYNNYPWPAQQRVQSPPVQQQQSPQPSGTRIIPIAIEGQDGPFNPNAVRGPISQSPMVIQNDPRTLQHQNSWSNGAPNQSKSFRILQKITDTVANNKETSDDNDQPAQIQRPLYSRQMGASSVDGPPTDQMRRMQLTDQDRDFMNRVKTTVDQEIFLHNEEDPRYRGGTIPSKSFKMLQNMIDKKGGDTQCSQAVPMQRPQPPRYVQQRPVTQQEDQAQPYVHPSEQQVPEPKKYMGSAIPSRSFKILQAMTTPENAAEMEGSGVEYEQISPNNYYSPYPYPYPYPMPPYYFPPVDPNWHYPYPPPIPRYYCYYPEYDSQNCGELHFNGYYPSYQTPQVQSIDSKDRVLQTPNIIVTPTPEDEENYQDSNQLNEHISINEAKEQKRKETALDLLSKKLNQISVKPELDMNISKDDKKYVGDCDKDLVDSPSPVSNERPSEIENNLIEGDNSDEDIFSSSSTSDSSAAKKTRRISSSESKEGLQAIKSVTNIKVYDTAEKDEKQAEKDSTDARSDEESDEETLSSSSSSQSTAENEPREIENSDSDEGEDLTEDEVVVQEVLSVIYEESEADAASRIRRESQASTASTLSDCSTTIANDDSNSDDDQDKIKEGNLEDNQSLVTVRLPLKFSFSRSSNDENITTVVVGDSEIEDETSLSLSKPIPDPKPDEADVSVTFNLSSTRSSSFDSGRKLNVSASSLVDRVSWAGEDENSDSEVSVSLSLPMKRDKFVAHTLSGDLINNISEIYSDSGSESSEAIDSPKSSKALLDSSGHNKWKMVSENIQINTPQGGHFIEEAKKDNNEGGNTTDFGIVWDWKLSERFEDIKKPISDVWDWNSFSSKYEAEKGENKLENVQEVQESEEHEEAESSDEDEEETDEEKEIKESVEKDDDMKEVYIPYKLDKNFVKTIYEDVPEAAVHDTKDKENQLLNIELENESEEEEEDNEEDEYEEEEKAEAEESDEEEAEEEETESTDSEDHYNDAENLTPTNICPAYKKYETEPQTASQSPFNFSEAKPKSTENVASASNKTSDENEVKISVRDRIAVFEAVSSETSPSEQKKSQIFTDISLNNTCEKKKVLSRNSSLQKSESEFEEDDSGVTDMSKPISETDTESESFPELKKMTRYQRAATHSRLFKLLQDESSFEETSDEKNDENAKPFHSKKKIVHNVSITRRTNPEALKNAETMSQRRERLSLPLKKTNSIDADNLSTSNSPSSPTGSSIISDKLVNELVQSLLLKKKSRYLRNLPMEKLQAAAKRVLEEDLDSLENTSLESTPALTPQEFKSDEPSSYADYYETWNSKSTDSTETDYDIMPSKAFKTLQEQSLSGRRKPWGAKCPRVLSSKTINRDLARVPESPEMYRSSSVTRSTPDKHTEFTRGRSLGV